MPEAYTVIWSFEEFGAPSEQFNFLVSRLQSEEISRMEHGEVEATIAHEGNELLGCLLQVYTSRTEMISRFGPFCSERIFQELESA